MKKYLFILSALLVIVSCSKKEVEVTYSHPLSAEFGANTTHKTDAVLYGDFSAKTSDELKAVLAANPSDLALIQLSSTIDGQDVLVWLESNRNALGYSAVSVVSGSSASFAALSNLNTAVFDVCQMADSQALQVRYGDYFFLVGAPSEGDLEYVATNIAKTSDEDVLFFFQLNSPSALLEGMVFTDCISAQFGPGAFPARTDYLYAAPGFWNKMGSISMNPVRFTIFSEEK